MNRLSKILIGIIVILTILLSIVTVKYLKQRDLIYEYIRAIILITYQK